MGEERSWPAVELESCGQALHLAGPVGSRTLVSLIEETQGLAEFDPRS